MCSSGDEYESYEGSLERASSPDGEFEGSRCRDSTLSSASSSCDSTSSSDLSPSSDSSKRLVVRRKDRRELAKEKKMKTSNRGKEREVFLPEHLLERIVAMIPYPSIYKGRCLSKSWSKKFSLLASLDNELEKTLATSFQKMVCDLSKDWPMGDDRMRILCREEISATELISQKEVIFPPLKFLPKEFLTNRQMLCKDGILVHIVKEIVYMANIFNQSWKMLCPRPNGKLRKNMLPLLARDKSSDTYKLMVFCGNMEVLEPWIVQIYDSKSGAWMSRIVLGSECVSSTNAPVYLNGFLYMVQSKGQGIGTILRIDLEEGKSTEELQLANVDNYFERVGRHVSRPMLVTCNAELFMIVMPPRIYSFRPTRILKVDLISLRASEIRGPPQNVFVGKPYSFGNSIFFPCNNDITWEHAYNVTEGEWSLRTTQPSRQVVGGGKFRPGSNHFLAL